MAHLSMLFICRYNFGIKYWLNLFDNYSVDSGGETETHFQVT